MLSPRAMSYQGWKIRMLSARTKYNVTLVAMTVDESPARKCSTSLSLSAFALIPRDDDSAGSWPLSAASLHYCAACAITAIVYAASAFSSAEYRASSRNSSASVDWRIARECTTKGDWRQYGARMRSSENSITEWISGSSTANDRDLARILLLTKMPGRDMPRFNSARSASIAFILPGQL